jgi:transcriptional regulator with XRE-family HTH domain
MATEFKDRFLFVIERNECSKSKAAEKLGISAAYVSQICSGVRIPGDRTISDICREFNVNEIWLRTGEGEPFEAESRDEEIMRFAAQTIKGSNEFRKAMVSMLAQLDAEDWEALAKIYAKVAADIKKSE